MKIGIFTSAATPYRTLQINEICKNKELDVTVYYTEQTNDGHNWENKKAKGFKEKQLDKFIKLGKYGSLNKNIINTIKENDILFIGGYEKPTYISIALFSKILKKQYVIIHDGICCNRLKDNENILKKIIKKKIIKNSMAIWGNGVVSKRYFRDIFNYSEDKIYNQYLTIDGQKILNLKKNKDNIRKEIRNKHKIRENQIVIQYSGRVIELKNIGILVEAISKINNKDIVLLITGGGNQEDYIIQKAKELGVKTIITGFLTSQEDLFKYYYSSDIFVLPSIYETWGLVVNEAMYASLPIIVSDICGCSLDFILEGKNGYKFNPKSSDELSEKIKKIIEKNNNNNMGEISCNIIREWNFENSARNFYKIIEYYKLKNES